MTVVTEATLPPVVGEGRVIGKSRCRWVVCPVCGEERWVRLVKGVPRSRSCRRHDTVETRERKRQALMGHPCSQETRDKISKARMGHIGYMLGKHHTVETKRKLSLLKKGRIVSAETKEKLRQINLGKRVSDETRAKISLALKGNRKLSDTQKEALRLINKGRLITEETREKMRQSHLGKKVSPETRAKRSKISKEFWANASAEYRERTLKQMHNTASRKKGALSRRGHPVSPETRNKIKSTLMGHTFTEESLAKMRRTQKRLWANPEYKKMVREAMCNGLPMSPNNCELALLDILNNLYPDEWAFVGDFTLVIDGKSPDFANINGKKLLIELFGDYWHKGQKPEKRIAIFSKFGYRTLVVWERELKDTNKLTERICEFVG